MAKLKNPAGLLGGVPAKTMNQQLSQLVDEAQKIVVIQANNPDGDSLASALALESILGDLEKEVCLYCETTIPDYLKFLPGWDRVTDVFPNLVDLAIMVDNSAANLVDIYQPGRLKAKTPLVIIDHHPTPPTIDQAQLVINDPTQVATGQLIYRLAQDCRWPISSQSASYLASSILSDSLGLTSQSMTNNPKPLRVLADLVELGVNLPELHRQRLERLKISPELVAYRGQLLGRIDWQLDGQLALLVVGHEEIKSISNRYNPTVVLDEMRLVEGVKIAIGFKQYNNDTGRLVRVTARIRCFGRTQIARAVAEAFGGGGHPYAAGAKWIGDSLDFEQIKADVCEAVAAELKKTSDETD